MGVTILEVTSGPRPYGGDVWDEPPNIPGCRSGGLSGHLVGDALRLVGSLVGKPVGMAMLGGGAEQAWWCGQVGLGIGG